MRWADGPAHLAHFPRPQPPQARPPQHEAATALTAPHAQPALANGAQRRASERAPPTAAGRPRITYTQPTSNPACPTACETPTPSEPALPVRLTIRSWCCQSFCSSVWLVRTRKRASVGLVMFTAFEMKPAGEAGRSAICFSGPARVFSGKIAARLF